MPMHNQISGSRWDSVVRRLFGIHQPNTIPQVAPELLPMAVVQEFTPEQYFLREEKLGAITGIVAAGAAGTNAMVQLFNGEVGELPPGKLLTIIEKVTILGDLDAQTFQIRIDPSASGVEGGPKLVRDTRWVGNGQSVGSGTIATRVFTDDTQIAAFGTHMWTGRQDVGDRQVVWEGSFVLGLNQGFIVFSSTEAQGFTAHFEFRERQALPDEVPRS